MVNEIGTRTVFARKRARFFLAAALLAVPAIGAWELLVSPHVKHLLAIFAVFELLAIAVLATEYFAMSKSWSEAKIAHDRLHMALASGKAVGWEWDLATGRNSWFGDLRTIFGIRSDTFSSHVDDFFKYVHPEDRKQVAQAVAAARKDRAPYEAEFRIVHEDGTVRWISATGSFYYAKNGKPERMLGSAVDITERKQIENKMHESETRLRGIVDSAMDAIIAVDEDQQIVLFNGAAEKMYGCSASQAIGSPLSRFIPEPVRTEHEQHVRSSGESPITNRSMGKPGILHGIRANGEEFPIEASISQVNPDGKKLFIAIIRDITERHQTEEALRTSTERLRLAMQAGRMYVDEWELSSNSVMRSAEAAEVLGKDVPLQTTMTQVLTQVHLDDRNTLEHFLGQMTPELPVAQVSYRVLRPDGTVLWLEKRARGLFDESGTLMRTISVVADVTDRKQSEQALRASEERFRRVVEHISDALTIDNVAGQIIFANDRFSELFGLSREQQKDLKIEDYVAPEYRTELRDRHDRRMRGESVTTHFEYEGVRVDGERIWLEVDVVPIVGQGGEIVGTQSATRDITERKRVAQSLGESEQMFRFVANSAPVMIWIDDTDKSCSYVNQQWLDFTGRPLDAELGTGWAEDIHPEDLKTCWDTYSRAFDNRETFSMQYRLRRHDGQYRWIEDRAAPRFTADGSFAGYIGSCYDITERKLAELALQSVGRRLIEAHEQERTWIARELHDDTCQRLALLTIELARWSQEVPESAVDIRKHFEQARKELFDISKDVQALSHRLHSSKLEYLGLATGAKSFCREFSEQHKVRVEFSHTEVPTDLSAEVSLTLFRVMQEALQNAIKHSHANRFEVMLQGDGAEITLIVSDRGTGFDQHEAATGRGLGLISMSERVQLVDGSLVIESKPGQGTTIRARVPIQPRGRGELSAAV